MGIIFGPRAPVGAILVVIAIAAPYAVMADPAAAGPGRAPGEDLVVTGIYIVSGAESWRDVFLKPSGTLLVPPGASLGARSILLQGGSFQVDGGAVSISQDQPGQDALLGGFCTGFNLTNGASVTLTAPDADASMELSEGGEALVQVNASDSIVVTGGSSIRCTGGSGHGRETPWTSGALGGRVSAGGRALIRLGGPATPRVEVSGGARLVAIGQNGGRAADGMPGAGALGGTGGGYSNGGLVGGHVGAGGDGRVELAGERAVLDGALVDCSGGRGGNAGRGGAGSVTAGPNYYYQGGGGGGGYAGGNGGSDYLAPGKGATVSGFVGAGGAAALSVEASELSVATTTVRLVGGDGGSPGAGGSGGTNPLYGYYSPGGGGGGFGGGGGGSAYATGGGGTVSGNVGAGGEANLSLSCRNLTLDGLQLKGNGGGSQGGASGGNGAGAGGGGGGFGGGGGGGFYYGGGAAQVSGNVGAGGNATFVASARSARVLNLTADLRGGPAGNGGRGGNGGTYGGGGGGGFGGGGGAGYYNYNTPAGPGQCGQNVGRGGLALFRLASSGDLWVNGSRLNLTGGAGGNAGEGGNAGGGGGGGGGYVGSGGAGYYGSGGEGSAGQYAGDGGDAQMELYCSAGSIPEKGLLQDLRGGPKGDGLTNRGGGLGGSGKGRATSNGSLLLNMPRLVPVVVGPPDGSFFNDQDPQLAWMRCPDAVIFPSTADPVRNYEVAIDDDPTFASPEVDVADIKAANRSFTPAGLTGGNYFWRVRALYSGLKSPGWSPAGSFLKNGPPRLARPLPPLYLAEDTDQPRALDLDLYFTDDLSPGRLSYEVAFEQDPAAVHAAVNGSWLDVFAVMQDWHGSCNFSVRATDAGGKSALSNTFTVTVSPVNDPPRFVSLPVVEVTEDRPTRFDATPYIDDVDNGVDQLSILLDSPNAQVEGHVITFRYTTEVGTDRLDLGLSDGQAEVHAVLEVRVKPVNDPPRALPLPELSTDEDCPLLLDLAPFGLDEEDGPAGLRWRAGPVPPGLVEITIDGRSLMRVSPLPDASGSCVVTMVLRDGSDAECQVNLSIRVVPVNDPPVLARIPVQAVKVNTTHQLDLRPFVSDVDNAVSDLRVATSSVYASVSGLLLTFRYPADEALDAETVRISVSDGRSTVSGDVAVALRFPPVFTGDIGVITVGAGKAVSLELARLVQDREDGPSGLRLSVAGVDQGIIEAGIDGNGRLTVRSLGSRPAATSFEIIVRDLDGNTANRTVQVAVTAPRPSAPDEPALDLLPLAVAAAVAAALVAGSAGACWMAGRRGR